MSKSYKSLLLLALPVILSVGLSYFLQIWILRNQSQFTDWLASFGPLIILVYVVIQMITIIIAPLGGFFMVVAMITLFGPGIALTIAYLVSAPAYLINFYLAKKFGRPLVIKIIGKDALGKIDNFVKSEGLLTLILTRFFQGGNFDYLSYGWGLTNIPFKTFAIVNFLVGAPATLLTYFVISRFENLTFGIIAFYVTTILLTAVAVMLHHQYKKTRK